MNEYIITHEMFHPLTGATVLVLDSHGPVRAPSAKEAAAAFTLKALTQWERLSVRRVAQ